MHHFHQFNVQSTPHMATPAVPGGCSTSSSTYEQLLQASATASADTTFREQDSVCWIEIFTKSHVPIRQQVYSTKDRMALTPPALTSSFIILAKEDGKGWNIYRYIYRYRYIFLCFYIYIRISLRRKHDSSYL